MAKEEGEALLDALGRVTACYRHLVLTVGGAADSQELREELRQTRRRARQLAAATRTELTAALRDKAVGPEERAELGRLWAAFSACLELLEGDMRRALELGRAFPLRAPRKPLVRTGLSGGTSGVAARALSVRSVKYEAEPGIDVADLADLEREIREVGEMLYEMETKVNVPRWTVEATRGPGAELRATLSAGASSLGGVSAEGRAACDLGRVLAGGVFTAVLLAAIVLAVCVAKLA